jgi:hypothetical protein
VSLLVVEAAVAAAAVAAVVVLEAPDRSALSGVFGTAATYHRSVRIETMNSLHFLSYQVGPHAVGLGENLASGLQQVNSATDAISVEGRQTEGGSAVVLRYRCTQMKRSAFAAALFEVRCNSRSRFDSFFFAVNSSSVGPVELPTSADLSSSSFSKCFSAALVATRTL